VVSCGCVVGKSTSVVCMRPGYTEYCRAGYKVDEKKLPQGENVFHEEKVYILMRAKYIIEMMRKYV
jgi:hypothetical protein